MTEPRDAAVVVFVTGPDLSTLQGIACEVVGEHLAACANLIDGVTSIYRWQGAVHEDPEALAMLKTTRSRIPALRKRIEALHPYDVPEFLALPVEFGLPAYLSWLAESVREEPAS